MSGSDRPPTGYRAVLRNRDFRLLITAFTVSYAGTWTYSVALVVFVFDTTHSPAWIAAAAVTRYLAQLLASPIAGLIADRVERIRLLVRLDVAALCAQAGLAAVAALHGPVVLALVMATLTAVASAAYDPAMRSASPALVPEEDLAAANSLQAAVEQVAMIAGPAVSAAMLLVAPAAVVFAINAATFAFSAVIVGFIRARSVPAGVGDSSRKPLRQMAEGLQAFVGNKLVAVLAGFSIVATFVYGTDTVLLAVLSKNQLGTGSSGYGYLLAGIGVGGLLMTSVVNRLAAARRLVTIIVVAFTCYCLPTAALVWVHSPPVAFVLEVVRGASTLVVDVLAITAMQRLVAPSVVARVFGVFFALVLGAAALGALLMPALLSAVGLTGSLIIMGVAIPAVTLAAYPWLRGIDSQSAAAQQRLAAKVALMQRLDIFSQVSRGALEGLAKSLVEETVPTGTVVLSEGAEASDFFVLVQGSVVVSARGEARARRELRTLTAPDYFGEIGLVAQRPRTATVTAQSDCVLFRISGTDFLEALTAETISPAALGRMQTQLARTHPTASLSFGTA